MSTNDARRHGGARGDFVCRIAAAGTLLLAAGAAHAASYVVTSLNDADIGTTTCSGSGACNLRDAIDQANRNAGADSVSFQAGLAGTLTLTQLELAISEGLTITGPGVGKLTIDADNRSRAFNVDLAAGLNVATNPVAISGLRIINGNSTTSGGAVLVANANLTLSDCEFVTNRATGSGSGGAVYASPPVAGTTQLSVQRCSFSDNRAGYNGGALGAQDLSSVQLTDVIANANFSDHGGGGIWIRAQTTGIAGGQVSNNLCGIVFPVAACPDGGGGMALFGINAAATLSIGNLRAENNQAIANAGVGGQGGALALKTFASATLDRLELAGNYAGRIGGAIQSQSTTLTLRNSTLSGNQSTGADGGGLALETAGGANLVNVSVAGNSANNNGGGISVGSGTTASALNTIVANNNASTGPDVKGTITFNYGLLKDVSGATVSGSNNLPAGTDPLFGPLAMNGGPTFTLLPAAGSPVLNLGDPATSGGTDQRGLPRVFGGRVDMGAVERQNPEDIIFRNGFD